MGEVVELRPNSKQEPEPPWITWADAAFLVAVLALSCLVAIGLVVVLAELSSPY